MKSHDLAAKLLSMPNLEVMAYDAIGPMDISSVQTYTISESDEEDCGNCEGRIGEEVLVIYVDN
jgi:hypothetical protein